MPLTLLSRGLLGPSWSPGEDSLHEHLPFRYYLSQHLHPSGGRIRRPTESPDGVLSSWIRANSFETGPTHEAAVGAEGQRFAGAPWFGSAGKAAPAAITHSPGCLVGSTPVPVTVRGHPSTLWAGEPCLLSGLAGDGLPCSFGA